MTFADFRKRDSDGEPTVDIDVCCDYHEILILRAVNEDRARKAAERKR